MMSGVDDLRIGASCRALRRRLLWRQSDLGDRVGVSQDEISKIERGHLAGVPFHTLVRVFAALDARFDGVVSWRAGALDRLLDERHAAIEGRASGVYQRGGWLTLPEVTFQHYADRGSIDLLSLHPETRSAAINEIKTDILSVEETHRRHDMKVRLAARIVEERVGWRPVQVGRILIVPEESKVRRAIERHSLVFRSAYPSGSRAIRAWIRAPDG